MFPSRKIIFIGMVWVLLAVGLTACGGQPAISAAPTETSTPLPSATATQEPTATATATETATPQPSATPSSTQTAVPTPTQTPTAVPTAPALTLGDVVVVDDGEFSFQAIEDYQVDVQAGQAGISSADDEILLFMAISTESTDKTPSDILNGFVETVSADAGELTAGEPYALQIGEEEGLAVDVSGLFLGEAIDGRIAVVQPDETRTFLVYGLAVNDRWGEEGTAVFDAVMATVSFTPEALAEDNSGQTADSDFPLPIPVGHPAADWRGIPIMPQATAGEEGSGSYYYIVEAEPAAVQAFYESEMANLGWSLLGVGEGETGALLLIFQQEASVASVSIIALDEATTYVFLVQ